MLNETHRLKYHMVSLIGETQNINKEQSKTGAEKWEGDEAMAGGPEEEGGRGENKDWELSRMDSTQGM